MTNQRRSWRRLPAIVAGFGLLVLLFAQLGPARILSLLGSLRWNFLVIVGLFACHESVRARAVAVCLGPDRRLHFRELLRIRFLGEAAGTLSRAGSFAAEPTRVWMLAGKSGPGGHAYAAAISELIANTCTAGLITVAVVGFVLEASGVHGTIRVLGHVVFWGWLVYVTVAIWALAARVYLIGAILRGLGALPLIGPRLRTNPLLVRSMEDAIMEVFTARPASLAQLVVLECMAQSILVLETYWTIRSMHIPITVGGALLIEVLTKAANVVQFVGVTEGAYAAILKWLGLPAAVGFTLALVRMVRSVTVAALGLAILNQLDRFRLTPIGPLRSQPGRMP